VSQGALDPFDVPVWFGPLREPTWLVPELRADAPRLVFAAERWDEAAVDGAGRDLRFGVAAFLAEAARFGTNAWPAVLADPVDPDDPPLVAPLTVLSAVGPEGRAAVRVRLLDEAGAIVAEAERAATDEPTLGAALEGLPFAVAQGAAGVGVRPVWSSLYALPSGAQLATYVRGVHACRRLALEAMAPSADADEVAARRADVRAVLGTLGTLATSTHEPFPALLFFGALLAAHDAGSPVVGEFRLPASARWTGATDRLDPVHVLTALVARVFGDEATSRRRIDEQRAGGDPEMQRWLDRVETVT
jgi:hypothetical protein